MKNAPRTIFVAGLCVWAVAAFVAGRALDAQGNGMYATSVLQAPLVWMTSPFAWVKNFLHDIRSVHDLNLGLAEQNRALAERLLALSDGRQGVEFSRTTAGMPVSPSVPAARVLGFAFGSGGTELVIDAGANQGVSVNDWAIMPQRTLVGKVVAVRDDSSVVRTIFDPELKIAVLAAGQVPGLFSFDQGQFTMTYLPARASVGAGDVVQTSGQDGVFRKGFVVGSVSSVQASPDGASIQKVFVAPLFSLDEVGYVSIVKNSLNP